MRNDQTQLHRHLGVAERRLQELAEPAHRFVGRPAPGHDDGAVGEQLDLVQLGKLEQIAAVMLEQGRDDAANDGNPLVPVHGQIAGEQFRQRHAASH